ncbi:hypothetical protein [Rhodopirellula europaea]|uniref:hypothetical protein n=1 Tax=Rhodopirellula europaea TaxID=1263866 RepID=UPI00034C05EC|nr:hypothetical protein [Rhodopirellula europaea]
MSERCIRVYITGRFDLGFIVEHPNGTSGQLRVPEMSPVTAELEQSTEVSTVSVVISHKRWSHWRYM